MTLLPKLTAALLICLLSVSTAFARNDTTTTLAVTGKAIPGKPVTVSATLSGGPYLVMDPTGRGGGTLVFRDGSTVIRQIQINGSTAQNVFVYYDNVPICYSDGSCGVITYRYFLSRLSTVSFAYNLPNQTGPHSLSAQFVVDDKFSNGSTSAPVTINARYPSITPIIDTILN
ncbi:hypothetical protein [Dyella tabacisoli]|uniref:DUF4402 domain-containing protein n=1 Tax=Dyella tabacisoli TaxID=2282381 RepID=A0A369URF5_9GAMM|nr:hypothetical protein [Dyella tabacisoli]RDD83236.1 hypothetical protein DVJ77_01125 [Dyella tabacisoli]